MLVAHRPDRLCPSRAAGGRRVRAFALMALAAVALVVSACALDAQGGPLLAQGPAARATDLARQVVLRWPTPGSPRLRAFMGVVETVPPPRLVSVLAPLRVHVAGDSFAEPVAVDLQRFGAATGRMAVDLDFQLGSGVSRSDYFDWPARLAVTQSSEQPEVLVFNAGGNDPQPIWTPDGWIEMGTPEWQREYARRAAAIMDAFRGRGVRVYWIGLPVLRDVENNQVARLINTAVLAEATRRPWVRFIDIWPLFVDEAGQYADYLLGPDGAFTLARQEDGVHLSREGSRWVSDRLYDALRADWGLPRLP